MHGDFVVWQENELVIQRVYPNKTFIIEKATEFFKFGILPELLGKWYSKPLLNCDNSSAPTSGLGPAVWCFCKKEEDEVMIVCDD